MSRVGAHAGGGGRRRGLGLQGFWVGHSNLRAAIEEFRLGGWVWSVAGVTPEYLATGGDCVS